jgi:dTDP-4-amino-4,6-dideoxygalactose transaminase
MTKELQTNRLQAECTGRRTSLKIPFLDLKRQYDRIQHELIEATLEVYKTQQFILGPKVEAFEERIAAYCGCRYAVGVSSGTDALLISLMCAGVGRGDYVITTPYTFFATVGAVIRVGAFPLFVDIEKDTYNMDPEALASTLSTLPAEKRARVKAIIPVHLFGQMVDMEKVVDLARRHDLTVIEDAAQAIGAEYQTGDGSIGRAGSMGDYGCFSFFPTKNLGGFGDGGMVTTNDRQTYERLKVLRVHGAKPKYVHQMIGGNFRLDALQAAVLMAKMKYLDEWTEKRRENAGLYRSLFQEMGIKGVSLPVERQKRHVFNQFVIEVREGRDPLKTHLIEKGVGCEVYYPVPLHMQECLKPFGYWEQDFQNSVDAAKRTLALPIFPELRREEIHYVAEMIKHFNEA